MGLFKRRPEIRVFAPRAVATGRSFEVSVVLDCPAKVPVDAVHVTFEARVTVAETGAVVPLLAARVSPCSGRELAAGTHHLRARFSLPADAPGSYDGASLRVDYVIGVHVDIPWWPDARRSFTQWVVAAPPSRRARTPRVWVSNLDGPRLARPYLEASLASPVARPGGDLRGSVAFAHTDRFEYRGLRFELVAIEGLGPAKAPTSRHTRVLRTWRMPLTDVHEQRPSLFVLRLPSQGLVSGIDHARVCVRWSLDISADVPWSRDPSLRIPIEVVTDPVPDDAPVPAPVPVGTERLALIWRDVAERTDMRWHEERLSGEFGAVRVELRRERVTETAKIQLVARLTPAFDAGLMVDRRRGRRVRGVGRRLGARDPGHLAVLSEGFDAVLRRQASILALTDLEGPALRLEAPTAGARQRDVLEVAQAAVALARSLDADLSRMGPPQDLAGEQAARWRAAATAVQGRFIPPAVAVWAPLPATSAWDVRPDALRITAMRGADHRIAAICVEVTAPLPIDRRHHVSWTRGDPDPGVPLIRTRSRSARDPLGTGTEAWEGVNTVAVERGRLRLTMPPERDPVEAAGLARAMIAALERMLGVDGPYR